MKNSLCLFVLSVVFFLTGCAPVDSLNPLYTSKDEVFDAALLGQWGSDKDGCNFAKGEDGGYEITLTARDDKAGQVSSTSFEAHLLELQGHRFLDMSPKLWVTIPQTMTLAPGLVNVGLAAYVEIAPKQSEDGFELRMLTAHNFYKVILENQGKTLRLVALDNSWVEKEIESGNLNIGHQWTEPDHKSVVLTAATHELQQLVLDHINDEQAFSGTTTIERSGSPTPNR
jgi:hypothetical protein